ncbi:hypothetical protein IM697_27980 [Streptomyces ferrugineus]|uniref:Uncharacterized protein n=1 Tax=Streptomyces ferrugineus TaxID=1413221 RepID=A0A7M2SCF1_9ACTN|nr:hypothetical protein [Streptomyces ferrugineus]QOV34002.1 hypothetical protein IM697_27980 [Streptomyces ferrugineus]
MMLVVIATTLGAGTRYVRQEPVTVASPAQLPGHEATAAPPGLGGFPKPDEVYVSPPPAELLHQLPTRTPEA